MQVQILLASCQRFEMVRISDICSSRKFTSVNHCAKTIHHHQHFFALLFLFIYLFIYLSIYIFIYLFAYLFIYFFYQGFLSRTLPTHRTAGERRGRFFIPLHHFHPLRNIQIFICNFACEMTITYFLSQCLYLRDCYLMRAYHFMELPFD